MFLSTVNRIDILKRTIYLSDGRRVNYDTLLSTIPLDKLVQISSPVSQQVYAAATRMLHSAVHVVGVGLKKGKPETLKTKGWIYFPENNSPYFRVTVFSNYSPMNVPEGQDYWSLMAEVCETRYLPVSDERALKNAVLAAFREDCLIEPDAEVVSLWHKRLEYAYPTPFLTRDEVLTVTQAEFEKHRVFSRGRFGGWKYEVSNQDHSFMQGVECADRIITGKPEITYFDPIAVNLRKW